MNRFLWDKRFVAVIQIDDKQFLVGGASNSVSLLAQLDNQPNSQACSIAALPGELVGMGPSLHRSEVVTPLLLLLGGVNATAAQVPQQAGTLQSVAMGLLIPLFGLLLSSADNCPRGPARTKFGSAGLEVALRERLSSC